MVINKVNFVYQKEGEFIHAEVFVNEEKQRLFTFYTNEISFTPEEVIGLTKDQLLELKAKRQKEAIYKELKNVSEENAGNLAYGILISAVNDYKDAIFKYAHAFIRGAETLVLAAEMKAKRKWFNSKDAEFWLAFTASETINPDAIEETARMELKKRYRHNRDKLEQFFDIAFK